MLSRADALALLRLHVEWGADEAILPRPVNRLAPPPAPAGAPAAPPAPARAGGPRAVAAGPHPAEAAESLAALAAAVEAYAGCALKETATRTVWAEGPERPGWLIIGDPPGDAEDREGRPFRGPGGAVLERALAGLGLARAAVLLAPLIPWRPPGGRPPSDAELAQCLPFLRRLIALAAPRGVLLCGALPARWLLPGGSLATLRRVRGKWQDLPVPGVEQPFRALATHSPALLRGAAERREFWADLRLMRRTIHPASENIQVKLSP